MLIGHFGVTLALKKAENRVNLGWLCLASLWLDYLVWIFVLVGLERVVIPENYTSLHYFYFDFPYSHGLVHVVVYAVIFALLAALFWRRSGKARVAAIFAFAVLSHWVGDAIEHVPELPLAGDSSPRMGLGLWNHMYIAAGLELLLLAIGLTLYYSTTRPLSRLGQYGIVVLFLFVGISQTAGQLLAGEQPDVMPTALISLIFLVVLTILCAWFDSKRRPLGQH